MNGVATVQAVITADANRWRILDHVRSLGLPDCWIGGGFVRNAIWDHLHGMTEPTRLSDVDVIWFDPDRMDLEEDRRAEDALAELDGTVNWSVKNQARMHQRNDDAPYGSATDAMRFWPETATAIAVRRNDNDVCEVAAPFGFEDLFALILRPTPRFVSTKLEVFQERVRTKGWLVRWPKLRASQIQNMASR